MKLARNTSSTRRGLALWAAYLAAILVLLLLVSSGVPDTGIGWIGLTLSVAAGVLLIGEHPRQSGA